MEVYRASQEVRAITHLSNAVLEPNKLTASSTDTQMRDALIPTISDYEYDSHSIPLSQDSDTPDWYYDPLLEDMGERNVGNIG